MKLMKTVGEQHSSFLHIIILESTFSLSHGFFGALVTLQTWSTALPPRPKAVTSTFKPHMLQNLPRAKQQSSISLRIFHLINSRLLSHSRFVSSYGNTCDARENLLVLESTSYYRRYTPLIRETTSYTEHYQTRYSTSYLSNHPPIKRVHKCSPW